MSADPAFEEWIDRARAARIEQVAETLGVRMPRRGEFQGPCPKCGGVDRFSVNVQKQVFNCRGAEGGDAIKMVQHVRECDFVAACEWINEEPPPRSGAQSPARDPDIDRERREERREDDLARAREDAREARKATDEATTFFESAAPIAGTIVEDYLEARGILAHRFRLEDLRFVPNLDYFGFASKDADSPVLLGRYHCMVAAIRDVVGAIIGVHRTYIDAGRAEEGFPAPSGRPIKLRPPGDRLRNKAKKAWKHWRGGLIRLGPIEETLAIGEGIETTLSWRALADECLFGCAFVGCSIAAGVALGNLSGGATGTIPHPKPPRGRSNAVIMNREPDPESPGLVLPAGVKRLVLIGDADSDPAETRAKLVTGGRRYAGQGVEVSISMPPPGVDWNDVLVESGRGAAA